MKPITQEWIRKAEGDFATAQRELQAQENQNYDAVCFHCQQCVEKWLKACLQESDIFFSRTHDLTQLLNLLQGIDPSWESTRLQLDTLTVYAVELRCPGLSASESNATEAFESCKQIRQRVRAHLASLVSEKG